MELTDFIATLPKAEVHLHIEGALPWKMIQDRATETLPSMPHWWTDDFRFADFTNFQEAMRLCYQPVITSAQSYHEAAKVVLQTLAAQNVRYLEISFGAGIIPRLEIDYDQVAAAIKEAAPPGMVVVVYCGLGRDKPEAMYSLLDNIFNASQIDGIDLHGDERLGGPAPFTDIFAQARDLGLRTKAHAGELTGPQTISDTLALLQVDRIEHGVSAIYDEALLDHLAEAQITLDICPTSNVKLQAVTSLAEHPIRAFFQRGIPVTVNSDDPTVFGSSLSNELQLLVNSLGFSLADLGQLQINAFQAAKLDDPQRQALITEVEAWIAEVNRFTDQDR